MAQKQTRVRGGTSGVRRGAGPIVVVLVLVALALLITVGAAMNHRRTGQRAAATQQPAQPVPAAIMGELENIPAATWQQAGTQGATMPVFAGDSDVSGGKAVVLYVGAGFCPYCAAARWSVVAALSRFGHFSGLTLDSSSPVDVYPSTATFSFYGSSYSSPYIVFEPVETRGDVQLADGSYNALQKLTPAQEALFDKYDAPPYISSDGHAGGIPFILVGGRYTWSGSPFDPGLLAGKSQATIAASLAQNSGDAAQAILSNANQMTASICAVDGGKPTEVCSSRVIQRAIQALPSKGP